MADQSSFKSLADIREAMREIDFCMLTTVSDGGLAGRPMSNNREVDYDGDSFFFADGDSRTVNDLGADPRVALAFQGKSSLLGRPGIFIAIEGRGELIRDRARFAEHWQEELKRWWPDGIDSPGLTLIKVHAERLHYWDGDAQGEVALRG